MAQKIADPPDGPPEGDFLVSWKDNDGAVHSSGALSHARAQSIVRVYGQMYPGQSYWVQALPREFADLHVGRVSRRRRSSKPEGH